VQSINPLSIPRRGLARFGEITAIGELADALGIIPNFHEYVFGPHLTVNLIVFVGMSAAFDLMELVTRPDLPSASDPCQPAEPQLPFGKKP